MNNVIELPGGNLLSCIGTTRAVTRMTPDGQVIAMQAYWSDTLLGIVGFRPYKDNVFAFASGHLRDTCVNNNGIAIRNTYPVIGKVDSLGHVLSMAYYPLSLGCQNPAGDVLCTSDGGIVAWGFLDNFFAMKADSNLALLWAKSFSNIGGVQFIKELPSGDLLAGFNMDTAGAVVARLDANGNFLWCKSYVRPGGMVHDAVIESDSTFIITGFTDSLWRYNMFMPLPSSYSPKLFMMKLEGTGNVQWCKGYDSAPLRWYSAQWSRIERTSDGNYTVLATMGWQGYHQPYRQCLLKMDTNGDTLWTRVFGATNYTYQGRNLSVLSDGGLLVSGVISGSFAPNPASDMIYLLKTDSMGHVSCHEQYKPIQVLDLFPTDSSFTLASLDGATMLPAYGVTDTIFPPIVEYNGCVFTTGISPDVQSRLHSKPKVYPNPTPGSFTVQFTDPLQAESYCSVYDSMGRLLYQRPWPQGKAAEEVDLSRFGSGTYILTLTTPEGVCYERVVVE